MFPADPLNSVFHIFSIRSSAFVRCDNRDTNNYPVCPRCYLGGLLCGRDASKAFVYANARAGELSKMSPDIRRWFEPNCSRGPSFVSKLTRSRCHLRELQALQENCGDVEALHAKLELSGKRNCNPMTESRSRGAVSIYDSLLLV